MGDRRAVGCSRWTALSRARQARPWSAHQLGEGSARDFFEPPDNEIPVGVPGSALLGRTADVAVSWVGARVHSTGVRFDLHVVARSSMEDLHHRVFGGRRGRGLLVGFEFADGRRASTNGTSSPGVLLHSTGGGGGHRSVDQGYWLHPVPPPGSLAVVLLAPELGVGETRTQLDATPFAAAVSQVQELWPWVPDDDEPDPGTPDV